MADNIYIATINGVRTLHRGHWGDQLCTDKCKPVQVAAPRKAKRNKGTLAKGTNRILRAIPATATTTAQSAGRAAARPIRISMAITSPAAATTARSACTSNACTSSRTANNRAA